MAVRTKLTLARGGNNLKDVAVASGSAISGGDAMEINIDATLMTRGDALNMLDKARQFVSASKWPLQ